MQMNSGELPAKIDFDSLWNYDQPAQTESKFRELLPQAEASGDTAYYAELLTQIARTLGLQQKFEAAHQVLDEVEKLLSVAGERPKVRYLLERGRVYNSSKQPDTAKTLFEQAWNLGLSDGYDFFSVDAAHMMAIVSPAEKALEWNLTAVKLAESSSDPKARNWLGSLYNNIGWTYFEEKKYDSALTVFQKALAFRQQAG